MELQSPLRISYWVFGGFREISSLWGIWGFLLFLLDCRRLIVWCWLRGLPPRLRAGQTEPSLMQGGFCWLIQFFFYMQVYWSSLFSLPKGVIIQVEQVLMYFLWKRRELNNLVAKVAWNSVVFPKKKVSGVLKTWRCGIRRLYLSMCSYVLKMTTLSSQVGLTLIFLEIGVSGMWILLDIALGLEEIF